MKIFTVYGLLDGFGFQPAILRNFLFEFEANDYFKELSEAKDEDGYPFYSYVEKLETEVNTKV